MKMKVDLAFSIVCPHAVPADHGYLLYSAVLRALPEVRQADGFGIHPIGGRQLGGRTLQLTERSRLVIRTDAEQITRFLPLAGKPLQLLDRTLRIGIPQVRAVPAVALRSRLITIKLAEAASQQGDAAKDTFPRLLESSLKWAFPRKRGFPLGKRRTLRIRTKRSSATHAPQETSLP